MSIILDLLIDGRRLREYELVLLTSTTQVLEELRGIWGETHASGDPPK